MVEHSSLSPLKSNEVALLAWQIASATASAASSGFGAAGSWQIRLKGQLCSCSSRLNITPYDDLKAFIQEELGELFWEDEMNEQST